MSARGRASAARGRSHARRCAQWRGPRRSVEWSQASVAGQTLAEAVEIWVPSARLHLGMGFSNARKAWGFINLSQWNIAATRVWLGGAAWRGPAYGILAGLMEHQRLRLLI